MSAAGEQGPEGTSPGLAASDAAGGAAGVGRVCCSHAPLPRQQGYPGALRGLARQVAGLRLGSTSCQPRQHGLPVTSAFYCGNFKVNSVVVACC